jgi:Mn-dependent DtxR family transcriptional regulator
MGGQELRKIQAARAIRRLMAILRRLSIIELGLQESEVEENAAAPAEAVSLEALHLCALARKQLFTAEKFLSDGGRAKE